MALELQVFLKTFQGACLGLRIFVILNVERKLNFKYKCKSQFCRSVLNQWLKFFSFSCFE